MSTNFRISVHLVLLTILLTDVKLDDQISFPDDDFIQQTVVKSLASTDTENVDKTEPPIVDIDGEAEDTLSVRSVVRLNEACVDSTSQSGTCQPLVACPTLLKIALRPQLKAEYRMLQRSYCGKSGGSGLQLFCCRNSFKSSPTSRPSPSTTRRTTAKPSQRLSSSASLKQCDTSEELNSRYCGVTSRIFDRVVGGNEAPIGAWPWAVLLSDEIENNFFFCGGSLITNSHVLTAAHCVQGKNLNRLFVRLTEHDTKSTRDGKTVDIAVRKVKIHEAYSTVNQENDIAILFLSRGLCFKDRIKPVCVADFSWRSRDLTNSPLFVAGWGSTFHGGASSPVLNEVTLKSYDTRTCLDFYKQIRSKPNNFDNILCAGDDKGGKDACQGDSGGPLVLPNASGKFYLAGVVSNGVGCGRKGFPGLYTRVSSFYDWIKRNMGS